MIVGVIEGIRTPPFTSFIPWWAIARDMATQQARDIVYPYHGLASIEPHFGSWNWK